MKRNIFKVLTFILIIALLTVSFTSISFAKDPDPSPQPPTIIPNGETNSYWVIRTVSNSNSTVDLDLTLKVQYSMWTDRTLYGEADYAVRVKKYPNYYVLAYSSFTYGTVYSSGQYVGLMTVNMPQTFHWYEWHSGEPYGTIRAYLAAAGISVNLGM